MFIIKKEYQGMSTKNPPALDRLVDGLCLLGMQTVLRMYQSAHTDL